MAMAEDKFKANDVEGAKKFALEAKTLSPSLSGLRQAIAAYEVHIAGKKRESGETHWCYAVLGVDPSDSFQAIKQRYRKLCVQIHPNKNRSAAADGTFNMISESYAEAQTGGANSRAGPKFARRGTRNTRNNSSRHGGANANGGPNSSTTYAGPSDANGGPSNTTDDAYGGGNNAYGSSSTAYPAYAAQGYWYWESSSPAYGSYSYHSYCQHNYYGPFTIHQCIFWF
ncbi:dnaJ-like subfamily B member 14-like [Cocos nucifera]|nr:dnaJ-like subfamily B member 14-like [Cocos nucifera]